MQTPTPLELARQQITSAREYTQSLLADFESDQWFAQPSEGVTHLAWQVGHLTMAQYMLTLFRLRGKTEADADLIDKKFMRAFLKGTTPEPNAEKYPPVDQIRATFDRVHAQVLKELAEFPAEDLDEPVGEPYVAYPNRLGSLLFCASHEMLHAGQIGLLRRLLGKPPVR